MLTILRCEQIIKHTIGELALPPELSVGEIVNSAGRWVCGHPWTWLERTGGLDTVASQEYIDLTVHLPGFQAIYSAQYIAGTTAWLQPTDLGAIIEMRAYSQGPPPYPSFYAIVSHMDADGNHSYRMELWPTPTTSTTGDSAVKVHYRVGFQTPRGGADTARIAIPEDWESLFIEALLAYAQGYDERDVAGVAPRLEAIRASDLYQRLVRQDAMTQSNFGTSRGGAVAMQNTSWPSRRYPATAQNPS